MTFARLLECNGIDYVVYKRDASAAPILRQHDEFKKYAR